MFDLIFSIIFIISLGGVLFILARKAPALGALSQNGTTGIKKHHYILGVENKIKDIFLAFEKQIYLHKFLSWAKVMILKLETKVDHLLHSIRKKNLKNK